MANQSSSSSSTSQIPRQDSVFLNWELVNHTDTDDESIFAEVQSLDSFNSDEDETLEIEKSIPDREDLIELGTTQIEFEGVADGSLIVGNDIEVCDLGCDEGCDHGDDGVDEKCSSVVVSIEGDEGFGGLFGGSVDLGKNPFLEMETLHQFLGNAIEASHALNLIRNECIPIEEVAFYNAVDDEMNAGGVNWNENVGNDDDELDHDDVEENEADEMDDVYDLDDELVPWGVADRFERQRMRKLGKRPYAKMTKSKKMPHLTIMRGCVRGKHGLGLKAS